MKKKKHGLQLSLFKINHRSFIYHLSRGNSVGVVILMILLVISVLPAGAASRAQAPSTLTFTAEADARVQQSNPTTNYGTSNYLFVDGASSSDIESFMRFTVSGATGTIQSVQLRVYVTSNPSNNSPAIHAANNSWAESAITWKNRPARTSGILDNKGSSRENTWLEYNVSPAISGDGTYTFVLVADSADGIRFSSREGSQTPELVVTFGSGSTATQPPAATASSTTTPTSTTTSLPTALSTGTQLPTASRTATSTGTQPPAPTSTSGSGDTFSFTTNADARVVQASPSTNYGNATTLQADGNSGSGDTQTSYIRFITNGISGAIQSVKLRVFCTTNGTTNGPAVHLANNNWTESGTGGITWNNRPALIGGAVDNRTTIGANSWVEYDVTSLVTGNATYTFALVADSTDGVVFSSREGTAPPQLVVTLGAGSPPATHTPTSVTPQSSSPTPVTRLYSFGPGADAYVDADSPSTNYGSDTQLRGDGSPVVRSYLRFDVQGLTGTVTRATLRIFANSASSGGYDIQSVSNNTWVESTITYNNAPAVGSVLGSAGDFNAGVWTTVDITPYITGNGTYNLALTVSGSTAISFASREVGNNAPQLAVEAQGGVGPSFTTTPVNTGTPTATATPLPTATRTATSAPTSSGSVVLVGAGDIASCNRSQDELTAQLLDNIPGTVFTAGDNAYVDGTYTEYLNCYEPTWGRHKSRTKPSPGNHDYLTSGAAGYFQYFNNVPSYYAYDLGAWRIYSLNSEISASATSAQVTWLKDDLAANPSQCVLAYWHRPRWGSGTNHGGTTAMQTLWQILYDAGAELVVNGHEHHYERFTEMNASGAAVPGGLREIIVGTGGAGLYPFSTPLATSQVRNDTTYGVLKLTLHPTSYDWQFVPIAGATFTDSGSSDCH